MDSEDMACLYDRVGESFGIEFDSYVTEVGTVGSLYDYIAWKLGLAKREASCLCPPTFFALRKAFTTQFGMDAKAVSLNLPLAKLMPWRRRRRMWRRLSETLDLEFPELQDAPGATIGAALIWVIAAIPLTILLVASLIDDNLRIIQTRLVAFLAMAVLLGLGLQVPVWLLLIRASRLFQFRFPYGCRTMGDLVVYLVELNSTRMRSRFSSRSAQAEGSQDYVEHTRSRCTHAAAFLRIRKALAETNGRVQKSIRSETRLAEVVGRFGRRTTWRILELNLDWDLPALVRSRFVVGLCIAGYIAILAMNMHEISDIPLIWWLAIPYLVLAYLCTIPLAVHFPRGCESVKDLAKVVTDLNYGRIATEYDSVNADEVWSVLRDLVAEVSGLPREDVGPDMPLVDPARFFRY